jgi:hypothetical protein
MKAESIFKAIGDVNNELLTLGEEQARSGPNWVRWVPAAASVIILLVVAIIVRTGNWIAPKETTMLTTTILITTQQTTSFAPPDIHMNELAEEPNFISHEILTIYDDYIPMSDDNWMKYFGATLPVEITQGLFLQAQDPYASDGLYKNSERGIYYDFHTFFYSNADDSQGVSICLSKIRWPSDRIIDRDIKQLETTTINNVEMTLAHYEGLFIGPGKKEYNDIYYAKFVNTDKYYIVMSKNITEDSFIAVLQFLVS